MNKAEHDRDIQRAIEASLCSRTRNVKINENLEARSQDVMNRSAIDEEVALKSHVNGGASGSTSKVSLEGPNHSATTSEEQCIQRDTGRVITSPRRRDIADCIAEMQRTVTADWARLNIPDGDTLVYIDPPAQQSDHDSILYRQIKERFSQPLRVKSRSLLESGSSTFQNLLGPTAQFRILRRRKLFGQLPPGIKYAIDLSPPLEGDMAVNLTAALSCCEGVRKWGLSEERWNISKGLVGGQDEFAKRPIARRPSAQLLVDESGHPSSPAPPLPDTTELNDFDSDSSPFLRMQTTRSPRAVHTIRDETEKNEPYQPQNHLHDDLQLPDDYSPVRHCLAIERVLTAIEGLDPKLDSAVKVWTTFAVAEQFGIRGSPLTDYIVRWLRAPPNTYFMEAMPEVVLKIANGLQCQPLCQDVFAILVGEAALAFRCQDRGFDEKYNIHGRKREDLPDEWKGRIQFARDVFVDRVTSLFESLTSNEMRWIDDLPEFRKLTDHKTDSVEHTPKYYAAAATLKAYVRGAIFFLLCADHQNMPGPVHDSGKGGAVFPRTAFRDTWALLRYQERYLTRSFWNILSNCFFNYPQKNSMVTSRDFKITGEWSDQTVKLVKAGTIELVNANLLDRKIKDYYLVHRASIVLLEVQSSLDSKPQVEEEPSEDNFLIWDEDEAPPPYQSKVPSRLNDSRIITHFADNVETGIQPECYDWPTDMSNEHRESPAELPKTEKPCLSQTTSLPYRNNRSMAINGAIDMPTCDPPVPTKSLADRSTLASNLRFLVSRAFGPAEHQTSTAGSGLGGGNDPGPSTMSATAKTEGVPQSASPREDPRNQAREKRKFFDINKFFIEVEHYLKKFALAMLASPNAGEGGDALELGLTNTLICLNESEMRVLPLWAGGNDDETGGAFIDHVPPTESGFSTAGPNVHTGSAGSTGSSEFEMLGNDSTIRTSTVVNYGDSDTMDRRRVYDEDSIWGEVMDQKEHGKAPSTFTIDNVTIKSESTWDTLDTPSRDDETSLIDMDEEEEKEDKGKGKAVEEDETYDDLFMDDDEDGGTEFFDDDQDDDNENCDDDDDNGHEVREDYGHIKDDMAPENAQEKVAGVAHDFERDKALGATAVNGKSIVKEDAKRS